MFSGRNFISHSSPLKLNTSEYERLIDVICDGVHNLPPIPKDIKEEAKRIVRLVQDYFPTRGRRRLAIAVAAIGIARGDLNVSSLKDLLYRAKFIIGEEIPHGQIENTLEDLRTFLKNLYIYKFNRKRRPFKFTAEERQVLKILKLREGSHVLV